MSGPEVPGAETGHADLTVEFCGEHHSVAPGEVFGIGRDAELVVDEDNVYLHRRLIELVFESGFWWIRNVGTRMAVTVSSLVGGLHSSLGPGAQLPLVLPTCTLLFTAGPTTYEVELRAQNPVFDVVPPVNQAPGDGELTLGAVALTATQFRLVLALCENALKRVGSGAVEIPSNVAVARRLGWSITTFNRRLDKVCEKFDLAGVRGLRGGQGRNAVGRRTGLVEYVLTSQIVRPEHLPLLEEPSREDS